MHHSLQLHSRLCTHAPCKGLTLQLPLPPHQRPHPAHSDPSSETDSAPAKTTKSPPATSTHTRPAARTPPSRCSTLAPESRTNAARAAASPAIGTVDWRCLRAAVRHLDRSPRWSSRTPCSCTRRDLRGRAIADRREGAVRCPPCPARNTRVSCSGCGAAPTRSVAIRPGVLAYAARARGPPSAGCAGRGGPDG